MYYFSQNEVNHLDIRIAVIDDDETDREGLTERIQSYFSRISQHDLAIYSFSSCEEFMAHHIYGSVHAVFLDIFMEGMTGLELGKRLRDILYEAGHAEISVSGLAAAPQSDILIIYAKTRIPDIIQYASDCDAAVILLLNPDCYATYGLSQR